MLSFNLSKVKRNAKFWGISLLLVLLLAFAVTRSCNSPKEEIPDRIDSLMSRMTFEEKLGQLNLLPGGDLSTGNAVNTNLKKKIKEGQVGAVLNVRGAKKIYELQRIAVEESRLGIPLLVGLDVIHGYETVLPIPLAQACSWDTALVRRGAEMAAEEATAAGINWTYSPMVDVAHDARWGRIAEGYGEDPFLSGEMGAAAINGYQGAYRNEDGSIVDQRWTSDRQLMACVKHFALYGAVEAGKDYNYVDMSESRMENMYLPPYKRCVEAGAGSVMTSFNLIDDVPATANGELIDGKLRRSWDFDGFVVTDYASISEMETHGVGNSEKNAYNALNAGTDMDMCSEHFVKYLDSSNEEAVDIACRRVLEAKERLGLLDDPYRFCKTEREKTDLYTSKHRKIARKMATESFVLLKNEGDVLPLKKSGHIALIGPLANTRNNIVGCWSTGDKPQKYSTLYEAMTKYLGSDAVVTYAQGSNIYDSERMQTNADFGRHITRVDKSAALAEAVNVAQKADVVVLALGELAEMSGESSSRSDISMPNAEKDLMEAIVKLGKPVVLLNFAGRPTDLSWESEHIPAIMNVWFAGSETGDAICDVLFGDVCPSGKLVTSMPRCVGQLPLYYNHTNGSRPVPNGSTNFRKYQSNYIDVAEGPLYPFGFGLSYTKLTYSNMKAEFLCGNGPDNGDTDFDLNWCKKDTLYNGPFKDKGICVVDSMRVSVTVSNKGSRDADEVVQLYVGTRKTRNVHPVKQLVAFKRVHIKAGQSKRVSFSFQMEPFSVLPYEGDDYTDYTIMIGGSSEDVLSQKCVFNRMDWY